MTTSLICQCTHVFYITWEVLQGYYSDAFKKVPWLSRESVFNKIVMVNIVLSIQTMHYIRIDTDIQIA